MNFLKLVSTVLCLAILLNNARSMPLTSSDDLAVREMILTDDGEDLNEDGLRLFLGQLVEFHNTQAPIDGSLEEDDLARGGSYRRSRRSAAQDPSLALNDYLTVGKPKPPTSTTQEQIDKCNKCAAAVKAGGPIVAKNVVWAKLMKAVKQICPNYTGGMSQMACDGYIDAYGPIIQYAVPTLIKSPYSLCDKFLPKLGCGQPDHQHFLWEIDIPAPLADPVPQMQPPAIPLKNKYRALFMTDIHIDPEYAPGLPAKCRENMCCRNSSTPLNENGVVADADRAGYWGDYRDCDLPIWTFEAQLRHIKQAHGSELDFIFIAGDLPPHDQWDMKPQEHAGIIELVGGKVNEHLPGIPAFYSVGNHEAAPTNAFPLPGDPLKFSTKWLMDKFADVWMKWLDPTIANKTVRYAGFYTVELKPGWRLVSINDNYCVSQNFFLFARANISDPYGVLAWLVDTLTEAEKKGERVQIIGHIPPGDKSECLQAFSWNYYRIISRFAHIITGQFFGHRHRDFFVMYYDAETLLKPKSVAFVGPPGSPVSQTNIGYRIYEFDSLDFTMLDMVTYYFNLSEANANGPEKPLNFKPEYSARDAYSLPDMSAKSWHNFAKRLQTDDALLKTYQRHNKISHPEPCGNGCRRSTLCTIYQGLSETTDSWCDRFYRQGSITDK